MLILERGIDRKTVIVVPPSDRETVITATFTEIRFKSGMPHAKVGYDAPPEVQIDRMEIYDAKRDAKAAQAREAERLAKAGKGGTP